MYYYGGYTGNTGCANNTTNMGYSTYGGYGYPMMYNNGIGNSAAIILVLFILLVIIIGTRSFNVNN